MALYVYPQDYSKITTNPDVISLLTYIELLWLNKEYPDNLKWIIEEHLFPQWLLLEQDFFQTKDKANEAFALLNEINITYKIEDIKAFMVLIKQEVEAKGIKFIPKTFWDIF